MHARETILARHTGNFALYDDLNPVLGADSQLLSAVRLQVSKLSFQAAFFFYQGFRKKTSNRLMEKSAEVRILHLRLHKM